MVMQDLGGIFKDYKDLPVLSMACTDEGLNIADNILAEEGFVRAMQWSPETNPDPKLIIETKPPYIFQILQYPKAYKYATREEKEELLVNTRLRLREALEVDEEGYVYSFLA